MGTGNLKYDIRKSKAHHFSKKEASFYKLSNKQIKQLINYLTYDLNQKELNKAIFNTRYCPYCNSEDFYKIESKSRSKLYKFKCEYCNKKFTNLSRSFISGLLKKEYINRRKRFSFEKEIENIEVWLHFELDIDKKFRRIPRKNILSTLCRWRHGMLQIPKDLKKDHLVSINEYDKEDFIRLINIKRNAMNIPDNRFIVLNFKEGAFKEKESIDNIKNDYKPFESPLINYKNELENKKAQQSFENLKKILIESYKYECEPLKEPMRESKIYKDIEVPYKHTYILAYEMAVRNEDVKKILYALRYIKDIKKNNESIMKQYDKDRNSSPAIVHQAVARREKNKDECIKKLRIQYANYLSSDIHRNYLSLKLFTLSDIIKDFEDELRKEYLIIPKENNIITPEVNRIYIRSATYNSINLKKYKWYLPSELEPKYNFQITPYGEYMNSVGAFKGNDVFDESVLRPTFNLHIIDKNTSYVPINFTLPTEEITAFIEKIKADLQKNENIIKSPIELFGNELEIIDGADVEKYLGKSFEGKLTSMADALFAYDMFQYLSQEQNTLIQRRDLLQQELKNKLSNHIRSGRRTKLQKVNIKKITKEYEVELSDLTNKINSLGETIEAKDEIIKKSIEACSTTIERYRSFMNQYIEEKKYKKLFLKTKNN